MVWPREAEKLQNSRNPDIPEDSRNAPYHVTTFLLFPILYVTQLLSIMFISNSSQSRKKVDDKCNNCGGQKNEEEKLAGGFKKTLTNYVAVWLPKGICPVCQELTELLRQDLEDE